MLSTGYVFSCFYSNKCYKLRKCSANLTVSKIIWSPNITVPCWVKNLPVDETALWDTLRFFHRHRLQPTEFPHTLQSGYRVVIFPPAHLLFPSPSHPPTQQCVTHTTSHTTSQHSSELDAYAAGPRGLMLIHFHLPRACFLQSWRQCHLSLMTATLTDRSSAHTVTPTEDTTRSHTSL